MPVIFYTSGLRPDYHQLTDDVDKIDFPAMARYDQLVFHNAWALANRDARVVVNLAKPWERGWPPPVAARLPRTE